ncbi:chorismate--pyruvate lyase family protein [Legionella sp. D16C41]|uniref:chorismate--pyruvate lyase family protein n=1 Tax=Legionella sp. D16C41 TaxID=3402688 RepID=UPI003AF8116E
MSFNFLKNEAVTSKPSAALLPWLTHQQSLTRRLQNTVGKVPQLTLLKQQWHKVDWWDQHVLGLKEGEKALHREIVISINARECWYGRTVIPINTYQHYEDFFARLKQESLGELIFGNNLITRMNLNYYCISAQSIEYYWLKPFLHVNEDLWARFAVFAINKHLPFYLIEILLPDLLEATNELA